MLVAGGCGDDAEPTAVPAAPPTSPPSNVALDPLCFATEAYSLEHLVVVMGQDPVPTAFDAVNQGGCEFRFPVDRVTVELSGGDSDFIARIELSAPTTEVKFPLPRPTMGMPASVPDGLYQRTVTVSDSQSGNGGVIQEFDPVILVRDPDSVTAKVLRAGSRWDRSRITSYMYRANWQCFCVQEYVADVDVQVANGQVAGTAFVDSALGSDVPDPQRFGTVENLFFHIEDAIAREAARIDVEFDPELGYPARVFIDYDERVADEEQGFTVTSLTATN